MFDRMSQIFKIILIEVAGVTTSLISIGFYFFMLGMGSNFITLSVSMVFPVGAIVLGWIATYGFFWGIKKTNTLLTINLFISALILSIGTYFLIKYLTFVFFISSNKVSFFEYYLYTLTESKLRYGRYIPKFSGPKVGGMGYFLELTYIIGFISVTVYRGYKLFKLKYCKNCKVYCHNIDLFDAQSKEEFDKFIYDISFGHYDRGMYSPKSMSELADSSFINFSLSYCQKCFRGFLNIKVMKTKGKIIFKEKLIREIPIPPELCKKIVTELKG